MPSKYPSALAWYDSPQNTLSGDNAKIPTLARSSSVRSLARITAQAWQKLLPKPDIANCIALSKLRCIVTIVSLVLLMTDIPRTGLGIRNLQMYYPVPLMPSTAVRFGPFNYPVLHISRLPNSSSSSSPASSSAEFAGLKGDQPIPAARAWSYQYDTTSVGLRGAVELLNVTEFPDVLLYKPSQDQPATNPDSLLDLRTAFTMLDAFISAAQSELRPAHKKIPTTMRFATKHNWVDRVHHYVVRFASKNPAWRLHSLHVPLITPDTQSLAICSNAGVAKQTSPRPRFCNHPGIWKCKHPLDVSLPAVRLWDHMDLRFRAFKQRYPDLELDVALVSSQRLSSTSGAMRSTFYNYEALEVVVLTRGRRCADNVDNGNVSASSFDGTKTCTTVFVDDYRYERDIVQTNLVDWYGIISMLRGSAQAYVWIRVALLIYGAYVVVLHPINVIGRLVRAASIVLRIPFEVVVYSSLLPVNAYVIALLLDGSFMDIYLDSYWASVGGAINFELVAFLQTTAVQMRNVWLLAVLVTVTVLSVRNVREFWSDGSPGIRGHIICFTSTLTIVGPYKNTIFRDTNINATIRVVNKGQTIEVVQGNPIGHYNNSTYLFDYSVIMLTFCIIVVIGVVAILKICGMSTRRGSWIYRETEGIILSSTPIVPIGARRFWLTSILSVQFYLPQYPLTESQPCQLKKRMSWLDTPTILEEPQNHTKVWPFHSQILDNTKTLKQLQESEVGKYSAEYRSVVQLMNISMMTDPWNFFWLRFVGIQLYLYKIRLKSLITFGFCSNSVIQTYATILPFAEDEMEEHTGLTTTEYELLNSASSRDVPITVLIQSG